MSEECSNFESVPDLRGVRKAVKAALEAGYAPESIKLLKPHMFEDVIAAQDPSSGQEWPVPYSWRKIGSKAYEEAVELCGEDEIRDYVDKYVAKEYKAISKKRAAEAKRKAKEQAHESQHR